MAGIYIHIPFCKQACHYCNFHFSTNLALQNDFTAALLKEIELRIPYLNGETVETIYFGGGTPSCFRLLPSGEFWKRFTAISKSVPDPEITLEVKSGRYATGSVTGMEKIGINRLSIGVQSFFTEDLIWMNRAHNGEQAVRAVEEAKKAGFDNFSLDLIYGSPGLTDEKWTQNLQTGHFPGAAPSFLLCING